MPGTSLWDAIYLRPQEIAKLLAHVRDQARHAWIYPLFSMAAHTGARRSELIAMRVIGVDFEGGVTIREKKRVKGKRSTRRAPMTTLLVEALREVMKVHPGNEAGRRAIRAARAGRRQSEDAWRR